MASPSIMRIIDAARFHAPGALDGVMRLELYNTLKQFTRDSCIWRELLSVYVDATSYDYDLVTVSKGVIHTLMSLGRPNPGSYTAGSVTNNPSTGTVVSGDYNNDFNSDFSNQFSQAASATQFGPLVYSRAVAEASPRRGALIASGAPDAILRIAELPNASEVWAAVVALTVTDPTDGDGIPFIPDWIVQKYQDPIMDGLLSRLMVHPAKPYSSDKGAAFHGRRFMSGIATARIDARHGAVYGGQRWSFPQAFRSRTQRTI